MFSPILRNTNFDFKNLKLSLKKLVRATNDQEICFVDVLTILIIDGGADAFLYMSSTSFDLFS